VVGEPQPKVVLLAGASGFVGRHALDALLAAPDVGRVIAVTRRALGRDQARLANRIVQFERIEAQLKGTSCDAALCALGTTLAKEGSAERFRAVEIGCVLGFARAAYAANAKRFVVVSSVGADPDSRNLYLRTKGEVEEALAQVGFESLDILEPSVILGWRGEVRPLELVASAFMPLVNPLLVGKYATYRGISARTLAQAMVCALRTGRRGVQRYTYPGILALIKYTARYGARIQPPQARAGAR